MAQWERICVPEQEARETGFNPWVRKIPWSRKWQPTPVLLPGKFHGQRSLAGYSPWGREGSDVTHSRRTEHHKRPAVHSGS